MRRSPAVAALALTAALLGGCGSTSFTADELIAELNRHGGEIALGQPLTASQDGIEIHSLSFTGEASAPVDVHAAGSLLVADGEDPALEEFHRCEQAASLVCFRVANTVLMFEDAVQQADLARLADAIRALAAD